MTEPPRSRSVRRRIVARSLTVRPQHPIAPADDAPPAEAAANAPVAPTTNANRTAAREPAADNSIADKPIADKLAADSLFVGNPVSGEPGADKLGADESVTAELGPDEPVEDQTGAGRTSSGEVGPAGRRWRLAVAGMGVLLAVVLVGAGLIGRDVRDQRQVEAAHQQALAAARQAAVDFLSISAATVDRDIERIAGNATGDFREEFTRSAAQVRSAVTENKVASRGTVLRTGLVSGDTRAAVVLVAVDATVKNKGAPNGRLSHYRIRVGLSHDRGSGRWLINQLQFVG
jgi:Mce-associated membrane protein